MSVLTEIFENFYQWGIFLPSYQWFVTSGIYMELIPLPMSSRFEQSVSSIRFAFRNRLCSQWKDWINKTFHINRLSLSTKKTKWNRSRVTYTIGTGAKRRSFQNSVLVVLQLHQISVSLILLRGALSSQCRSKLISSWSRNRFLGKWCACRSRAAADKGWNDLLLLSVFTLLFNRFLVFLASFPGFCVCDDADLYKVHQLLVNFAFHLEVLLSNSSKICSNAIKFTA